MIVQIDNEWDRLVSTLLVEPIHFELTEPINTVQARLYGTPSAPSSDHIRREHAAIRLTLSRLGVICIPIPAVAGLPFQFNVRDAGVIVGDVIYLARMARPVRHAEPEVLRDHLKNAGVRIERLHDGCLEGGDVIVRPDRVLVGMSERTDEAGAQALAASLPEGRVVETVELTPGVLHLDVALSCPMPSLAIAYLPAFARGLPECLRDCDVIEATESEFESQGVNVLPLGGHRIMVDQRQERLIAELGTRGATCVPCCVDHISRVGGGLRCLSNALTRKG